MKTIKDAIEYFDSVWPECVPRSDKKTFAIGERIYGNVKNIGEIRALREDYSKAHFRVICDRRQFENAINFLEDFFEPAINSARKMSIEIERVGEEIERILDKHESNNGSEELNKELNSLSKLCSNYFVSDRKQTLDEYLDSLDTTKEVSDKLEKELMTNKYKSIPVTNMTIWQLGQAVSDGSEFYDAVGNLIFTSDKHGTLYSHQTAQVDLNDQLMSGQITTREPIEWWNELPKLVRFGAIVGIAFDNPNYRCVSFNGYPVPYDDCTPLTREEAAEYGVEL